MKYFKYYLFSLGIILLDQLTKLLVHNYMLLGKAGEIALLGDWFSLHYTLNNGMAFGIQFDWFHGKLFLSLFRLLAIVGIGYYLHTLIKNTAVRTGFVWCISLIFGGAVGNLIDSIFYGVWLNNALPIENAPAFYPWFYGRVVDMFYFDIWQGVLPNWIPLMGGRYYAFWPIFNIADASIFIGVFIVMLWGKTLFPPNVKPPAQAENKLNT